MGFLRFSFFVTFYLKGLNYWLYVKFSFDILEVSLEFDKKKNIFDISILMLFAKFFCCRYEIKIYV